jgi:hypothetical protein
MRWRDLITLFGSAVTGWQLAAHHAMTCLRQKLSWFSCFNSQAADLAAGILNEKIARCRSALPLQKRSRQLQMRFLLSLSPSK